LIYESINVGISSNDCFRFDQKPCTIWGWSVKDINLRRHFQRQKKDYMSLHCPSLHCGSLHCPKICSVIKMFCSVALFKYWMGECLVQLNSARISARPSRSALLIGARTTECGLPNLTQPKDIRANVDYNLLAHAPVYLLAEAHYRLTHALQNVGYLT
jgi:hypothetical protein